MWTACLESGRTSSHADPHKWGSRSESGTGEAMDKQVADEIVSQTQLARAEVDAAARFDLVRSGALKMRECALGERCRYRFLRPRRAYGSESHDDFGFQQGRLSDYRYRFDASSEPGCPSLGRPVNPARVHLQKRDKRLPGGEL